MRLRTLLDTDALGLRLLSGGGPELERQVRGVMTTDLRDPSRYLHGGELVLTGLAWWRGPRDSEPFVRILAEAGVAGLAAGEAEFGRVPDDLTAACALHRLPLFAVAEEVGFADITEHVVRQVSGERAGDLAAVVDRHRRLMSAGPAGGGPRAVLDLLAADLDLRAWVLSATGRRIAAAREGPLPEGLGPRLAAHRLAAAAGGRPGPCRVVLDGVAHTLFPLGGDSDSDSSGDVRRTLLSDWLLAVRADARDWPPQRLDLLNGVARLIAAERDRRDAARSVPRRLAQEVLALLGAGAPPAEIGARLRVVAPVLVPGPAGARWQVVVARVEWPDAPFDAGPPARAALEELLAPAAEAAVAHEGGEAVAFVPLAEGDDGEPVAAETVLGPVREVLARGLRPGGRLTLGVSAAVPSAEGLRGAVAEARHARRVAAARRETVSGAGHDELASHVLLLPFVPDDVRLAFTAGLLDPLRDYDRRHRSGLVATLEAFLAADGSWTRCAARLHLHVNTLRYRIGRIEQLTGRDLTKLEDKVDFFLALRMDLTRSSARSAANVPGSAGGRGTG
ncbi:PucR family transcriptional regulator [Streptomyces johnsoniae]|uniref:PucR family transcriptional regulator ligand-binding domain-containing protein n=1 Tax=Streptomyces johnsoniae TaxID=3075532 RepID=A0ABU2RZK7_9ACTN|nr:PucR family transcriptional regulator ligand-binding domain-containing protein [Streptomyces sp. DSM 41886]MDT0442150.1 PucR family transcriptional regulator ligand-binding domain-containing protein [Streptomyces sp. DSM 41886]